MDTVLHERRVEAQALTPSRIQTLGGSRNLHRSGHVKCVADYAAQFSLSAYG